MMIETAFGSRVVAVRSNGRVDLLEDSASPPRWVDWIGEVDALEEWGIDAPPRLITVGLGESSNQSI